jgi:N-acetylneuraminate 9-O-acetyltransferase
MVVRIGSLKVHFVLSLLRGTVIEQRKGCMLHSYQPKDASACLGSREVVFIGDSITRTLFFQFGQVIDPTLPKAPPDDHHKHSDHSLRSKAGTRLEFYWDPYVNTSRTHKFLNPKIMIGESLAHKPSLLVLGSGLWYLRYPESGGIRAWEANVEATVAAVTDIHTRPADEIVLLPIEEVVPSKLSRDRASSMHSSDIDAMNSDLYHRIHPPSSDSSHLFSVSPLSKPISLPLVFNKMLDQSQTEDGLHFSAQVVKAQANILLNLRCNDMLPKTFPLNKTCCRRYPRPSILQIIILGMAILWGPSTLYLSYRSG